MNRLSDIVLKFCYRSDRDNLVNDFFIPTLRLAQEYKRAVGFFSSSALCSLGRGLDGLLHNNGIMKIVASPVLSPQDIEAIENGYRDRKEVFSTNCTNIINTLDWNLELEVLAWLIASNRLNIKLAYREGKCSPGIYHEKLGIIKDSYGDFVTFSGSANESISAHEYNFESLDIDKSWDDRREVTKDKESNFDKLWCNATKGLIVLDFTEAAKESLIQRRKFDTTDQLFDAISRERFKSTHINSICKKSVIHPRPAIPSWLNLFSYQQDAIKNWKQNMCRGIFKMATGTGKTKTALSASIKLLDACARNPQKPSLAIIIICPYIHLVSQWSEECDSFNIVHLNCYGSSNTWRPQAESMLASLKIKSDENQYACYITTIASFVLPPFQSVLSLIKSNNIKTLIIADEVHNLGADIISVCLPDNAPFRIALSATPERWFDEEGTDAIQNYFGKTVVEYGLSDALQDKRLTPYYYYPIVAELTEKETSAYLEISQKLSQYLGIPEENRNSSVRDIVKQLLMKRARIQASAENKMLKMFDIIREKYTHETHMLIYCGDGSVSTSDGDYSDNEMYIRQVDYVVKELGVNMNMKVFPFTSRQDAKRRNELRDEFAKGELQSLVAIRCLDEGVDIPATKIAFILASSTNPRQFIQRRGRVLRLSPETGKEYAIIYDFIVAIPPGYSDDYFKIERSLLRRELLRVNEFASLAKNKNQALNSLRELKNNYNLLDM